MPERVPNKKITTFIDCVLVAILVAIGLIVIFSLLHLDTLWDYSSIKRQFFSW